MFKSMFVLLVAVVVLAAAFPFYGDENRDGLFDGADRNRDGKVDGPYYGPYYGGYYGRFPYGGYGGLYNGANFW